MKNFLDNSIVIHNSKPPLRWVANWAGSIASAAVMRSAWLQEYGKEDGISHYINERIYIYLWPIYQKYGTFYEINFDMSDSWWNDYDENGVPYWETWPEWDYYDEQTGDGFRIIK